MSRPLRIEYPGAFYHITSRGNERKAIFRGNKTCERFLSYFESATERYGAKIHCFCLMPNHYHLLLETPRGNLHQILHHLNTSYTNYFNVRTGRVGHLFQGRYRAILVDKDSYALELSRYIHLNPVRAAMAKEPTDYLWSSYGGYAGERPSWDWLQTDFILGQMSASRKEARRRYSKYVEQGMATGLKDPLEEVVASTVLGSESFVEWVKRKWVNGAQVHRDLPAIRKLTDGPEISTILGEVERVFGTDTAESRRVALYLCHRLSGLGLGEIGKVFGISASGVSQNTRRVEILLEEDATLPKTIQNISKIIRQ